MPVKQTLMARKLPAASRPGALAKISAEMSKYPLIEAVNQTSHYRLLEPTERVKNTNGDADGIRPGPDSFLLDVELIVKIHACKLAETDGGILTGD